MNIFKTANIAIAVLSMIACNKGAGETKTLSAEQLDAAKTEVRKHDKNSYDERVAVVAGTLGKAHKIEGDKSSWFGLNGNGSCYYMEVAKSGSSSYGSSNDPLCPKKP